MTREPDPLTPPDSSDGETPARVPVDDAWPRGTQVNEYTVLERIGTGGQGEVYAAFHLGLDRKVALKRLHTNGTCSATQDAALLREARTGARLEHPNVVTVHNVVPFAGRIVVAMQFMGGGTLAQWADTPRPLGEVLARFKEAGLGLAAAHAAGVVHRDFKLDNVLLDERGVACVSDFGLAREQNSAASGGAGTRRYMAPEQKSGGVVTAAADQYSFCVALYRVLCCAWPEPGAPLRFPPADRTPAWVRAVLARGLLEEPAARYPSMEALLKELADDPSIARRQRLRALGVATLVAGLAVAIGVVVTTETPAARAQRECVEGVAAAKATLWSSPLAEQMQKGFEAAAGNLGAETFERVRARMEPEVGAWAQASSAACLLDDPTERRLLSACLAGRRQALLGLGQLFGAADRGVVESAVQTVGLEMQPVAACHTVDAALPQLEDNDADETLRPALARVRVLRAAGRHLEGLTAALELAHEAQVAGALRVVAEADMLAAQFSLAAGDGNAEELSKRAIIQADAVGADEVRVRARLALVGYLAHQKQHAAAEFAEQQAEAIIHRLGRPELLEAELMTLRAMRSGGEERRLAATRARELYAKHRPPDDALVMRAQTNWLLALPPDEALPGLQALVVQRERVLGAGHPDTALAQHNVAAILLMLERCDEADGQVKAALARRVAAGEQGALRLADEHMLHARILECRGQLPAALVAQQTGVELLEAGSEQGATPDELTYLLKLLTLTGARPALQARWKAKRDERSR